MRGPPTYITLLTSLPALPARFEAPRPPISRPRLDARLTMLRDDHAQIVSDMEGFLRWSRLPLDEEAASLFARARQLLQSAPNPVLHELVHFRLKLRGVVAALRRRAKGLDSSPLTTLWPEADWVRAIQRHYEIIDFGLSGRLPWLARFAEHLASGDATSAERELLGAAWGHHTRVEVAPFSFEAVLVYLCRWDIMDRWASYDADRGRQHFDLLLKEALGERAQLFG